MEVFPNYTIMGSFYTYVRHYKAEISRTLTL